MNIAEWKRQQTTIGNLKAHYAGPQEEYNGTVLRLRLESLLSNIDLCPPGLSSSAILIVRRLDSSATVGMSISTLTTEANWQQVLHSQIADLYASAARPVHGVVPDSATGVLFADPGEMLTCLTRDLLKQQAREHWYWRQVLREVPHALGEALPILWCEQVSYVPTILASLHTTEVLTAIAQLTPLALKKIIAALHERFELPSAMFTAIMHSKPGELPAARAVQAAQQIVGSAAISAQAEKAVAPWEQWFPTTHMPDLLPEAHYLLGLGLTLFAAPAFARSTHFAVQAVRWLQATSERRLEAQSLGKAVETTAQTQADAALPLIPVKQRFIQGDDTEASNRAMLPEEEEQSPAHNGSNHAALPLATKPEPASSAVSTEGHSEAVSAQSEVAAIAAEPSLMQQALPSLAAGVATDVPEAFHAVQPVEPRLAATTPDELNARGFELGVSQALSMEGVPTHLGGVLYLINLLTWLNLPHSWDDEGRFAEMLSGWAIVEALAHGLLGSLHEQYRHDPIWQALALLDGRGQDQPITAGDTVQVQERSFRLPVSWLKRFGVAATWSTFQQDERLLLFDDAMGFLVADVPLRGRTFFAAAHAEVTAYSDAGLIVSWHIGNPSNSPSNNPSSNSGMVSAETSFTTPTEEWEKNWLAASMSEEVYWWLRRVLGFVYCVLERALGEHFADVTQLAELLLCQRGQLVVSRTHVDLFLSLEEIRIAVRRAGLDRDPGWVPDLARIVYLHFE